MKSIAKNILVFGVCIMPLVFLPGTDAREAFIRLIAFLVMLSVTVILFRTEGDGERKDLLKKMGSLVSDPIAIVLGIQLVLFIVSTFFAYDSSVALYSNMQRGEGLLTFISVGALYLGFKVFLGENDWKKLFQYASLSSIVLFCIAAIEAICGMYRPDALSGNPIFLAGYFIFLVYSGIILALSAENRKWRIVGMIAALYAITGIFITETRGAIFGLCIGLLVSTIAAVVFGGTRRYRGTYTFRSLGVWILSIFLVAGLFLGLTIRASFWKHVPGINRVVQIAPSDSTTESRIIFSQNSLSNFFQDGGVKRMVFGWGWDNYLFFWSKHNDPRTFYLDSAMADRSHNKFVDMLVMTGIAGLAAYVLLWFVFIKRIVIILKRDIVQGLVFTFFAGAYLTFLLFAFDVPMILVGFYAVLAYSGYEKK